MAEPFTNTLYYGDNLAVLREHIKDESVDLIYLDPPFKSNQNYNVLFKEQDGSRPASQIKAFEDTWKWDQAAAAAYEEVVSSGNKGGMHERASRAMQAFRMILGTNDMLAYLSMMAPRLIELRRVLKPEGSIYLHCDPAASHYLKLLMDAVFHHVGFRNEVIWRRTGSHNSAKRYGPIHDVLLFYTRSNDYCWNRLMRPYMKKHVEQHFQQDEEGWVTKYYGNVLTGSGTRKGSSGQPWRGFDPTAKGRHWAIPSQLLDDVDYDLSELDVLEKLEWLFEAGYISIVEGLAWPVYQHRIKDEAGQPLSDLWAYQPYTQGTVFGNDKWSIDQDVRWLSPQNAERLGYQTQKPEGLLERIVNASSQPGQVVLDPFCGCGTAVAVAQKLGRRWIGIDITHLAVALMKQRLKDSFGILPAQDYRVIGEPTDFAGAQQLAKDDAYQFQWWALGLVGARPVEKKKGSDRGIDGRLYWVEDAAGGKTQHLIISVKSGKTGPDHVRDLVGTIGRENAAIGVLITLQEPTREMRTEAASAGYYEAWGRKFPRLQILTITELLKGTQVQYPPGAAGNITLKRAPKQQAAGPLPEDLPGMEWNPELKRKNGNGAGSRRKR